MNEIARCPQETVNGIRERAGHLLDPCAAGLLVDAGDMYAARLQLDHEEETRYRFRPRGILSN